MQLHFPQKRPQFREHIGSTLVLWSALLALLPTMLLLRFSLNQAEQQTHEQVIDQLDSVATLKFNQIEHWLNDRSTFLNLLMTDLDSRQEMVGVLDGEEHSDKVMNRLSQHLNGQQAFTEFFLYNTEGRVLVSTSALHQGRSVAEEPYFSPSLSGDYLQPPFYEVGDQDLDMILTRLVQKPDGTVVGVLAGRLELQELSEIMTERAGLGDTGETYLVSAESNYLVTASRFEGYPLTQAYHSMGVDEALVGRDGSGVYTDYRGMTTIGVYRWLPELQSALLAEMGENEALAPLYQTRNVILTVAAMITLLSMGIGLAVALRLTRPIVALMQAANRITAGDYALRVVVTRKDEIGQLGQAFNTMTEKLTCTIEELHERMVEIERVNQNLTIATAQAQEALRAKDAFLAVMSHELRTPLNAIVGFTGLLEKSFGADAPALHKIQRIRANADRLTALITNVLDMTRITSGKLQLTCEPLDLRRLVKDLSRQMDVLAQTKGVEFKVEIDDSLPSEIVASREALTKILTNLLSNAFKFTERGSVTLSIRRHDENVKLQVSDTGIGIPADMHDVIFETFRQVDNSSTKRAYGGSGLGLAIVKELCAALGGQITLASAVGEGSVFTVIFPVEFHNRAEAQP